MGFREKNTVHNCINKERMLEKKAPLCYLHTGFARKDNSAFLVLTERNHPSDLFLVIIHSN